MMKRWFLASLGCHFFFMISAVDATAATSRSESVLELGRALFYDNRLSVDGKVSCSSCHRPEKAFQDGQSTAHGSFDRAGTRNTPSLIDVASQRSLFWDGRRSSLADQALDPLLNSREHGLASAEALVAKLQALPEYSSLIDAVNAPKGRPRATIDARTVATALAAFEATIVDGLSPFEKFKYDGVSTAISPAAQRGWSMFSGRARCISCHEVGLRPPALFTDRDFHVLTSVKRAAGQELADLVDQFMRARDRGETLDQILLSDAKMAELGRFVVTESPADIGKFKTPSLRNVAITAPYMHDGSVATLEAAIDLEIYYRGTEDGHPLILTDAEKSDLIAFLRSLTSFDPSKVDAQGLSAPSALH